MARIKFFAGLTGHGLRNAQIWAVILPAYLIFGYNNGCAGSLLDLPSWLETFPQIDTADTTGDEKSQNSRLQGTVVSFYTLGAFFGSLACIYIGDKLGRIGTIQVGCYVSVIGYVLQAASFSLPQLIVGRLVAGVGFGAIAATAPNWQSECSTAGHRGAAVLFESLFISAGLALQGWINLGLSFASGSVTWRFPLALPIAFTIVVLLTIRQFPESPRWLLKWGRDEEACIALAALEGKPSESAEVRMLREEIVVSLEVTGKGSFADIFRKSEQRLFNRACLASAGQLFQQMGGINALAFYLDTIFHQYLGLTSFQARVISASVFTWQTICSPIGILTVDRFGRRKLMLIAAVGQGVCMAIVAGTASQAGNVACAAVAGVCIFLFSAFFPTGFLGLTFLYASEISPLSARVPITALSTGSAYIWNFVVAEITPVGFATIGWRYFIVYAVLNLFLIVPAVYFFFPETAGRHLEEVDEIFIQSKSMFDPVRVARSVSRNTFAEVDHRQIKEGAEDFKIEQREKKM